MSGQLISMPSPGSFAQPRPAVRWPGLSRRPGGGGSTVLAWVPGQAGTLVRRSRPNLAAHRLAFDGPVPLPGEYPPHSTGFRYWATAEVLSRAAGLWRAAIGPGFGWHGGGALRVRLGGAGAAGCYDRAAIYLAGGASPETACRVLGFAVLDALRPDLWDVAAPEADALHVAFGEATVQLAALDQREGAAAGATASGFPAAFNGMIGIPGAARLLGIAARRVPVAPNLLAQFAAELAVAAAVEGGPALAARLRALFASQELLARTPGLDGYDPHEAEDGTEIRLDHPRLEWVAVAARDLARPLLLCPASEQPRLFAAAPGPDGSPCDPLAPLAEACRHAEALARAGLVEQPRIGRMQRSAPGTNPYATHLLLDDGRTFRLVRQRMMT